MINQIKLDTADPYYTFSIQIEKAEVDMILQYKWCFPQREEVRKLLDSDENSDNIIGLCKVLIQYFENTKFIQIE